VADGHGQAAPCGNRGAGGLWLAVGEGRGSWCMGHGVAAGGSLWAGPREHCFFHLIQNFKQNQIYNCSKHIFLCSKNPIKMDL
jgi:hypothetical protein